MLRALIIFALTCLGLSGCTGVFFYPQKEHVRIPSQIGLKYEDVGFDTADGVRLHGWYLPAQKPVCGTILFLHGNAENISTHIGAVFWLPARGFNVFLPDYRGYGASQGTPSLPGVQSDIDAAMKYLLSRPDIDQRSIAIFGQSLGGASAIYYVAHSAYRPYIRTLIAESAFASHRDIVRDKLSHFWLTWPLQYPLSWTITNEFSPIDAVDQITPIPLLLMHGDRDEIVPSENSERLFAAAKEPKDLWIVQGASHIQSLAFRDVRERYVTYLRQRLCPAGTGRVVKK